MHQVEGGSEAFCSECQEYGHYQAIHQLRPSAQQFWWGWA